MERPLYSKPSIRRSTKPNVRARTGRWPGKPRCKTPKSRLGFALQSRAARGRAIGGLTGAGDDDRAGAGWGFGSVVFTGAGIQLVFARLLRPPVQPKETGIRATGLPGTSINGYFDGLRGGSGNADG